MTDTDKPAPIVIFWGSQPDKHDTPTVVEYDTEKEANAYFKGIGEADGWFDLETVDGPDYVVNEDGEVVSTGGQGKKAGPGERYIVWGGDPEPGSTPDYFEFETEAEACAFMHGAEHMVGWTTYFAVPDPSFKPYKDAEEAMANLSQEAGQALRDHLDADEGLVLEFDRMFVSDNGACVGTDWAPGDPIENEPVDPEEWRNRFFSTLGEQYGASEVDADSLEAMRSRMARMPVRAAHEFAGEKGFTLASRRRANQPF